MESYSRLHAPIGNVRKHSRSQSPHRGNAVLRSASPAHGLEACLERLDKQMSALGAQVLKAARAVGNVQDLFHDVEARVSALEQTGGGRGAPQVSSLKRAASPGDRKLSSGTSSCFASSSAVAPKQSPREPSASLRLVDAHLRGRFKELREWQMDVEQTVQHILSDAGSLSTQGRAGASKARSARAGLTSSRSVSPRRSGSPRAQGVTWSEDLSGSASKDMSEHQQPKFKNLGKRTEATISRLEEDLAGLRRELALSTPPDATGTKGTDLSSSTWDLGQERASLDRLYDELLRAEAGEHGAAFGLKPAPVRARRTEAPATMRRPASTIGIGLGRSKRR